MQASFTATAVGPVANPVNAGAGKTFRQYGLKVTSTSPDCVVALETSPDNVTYTEACRATGPHWAYGGSSVTSEYARVNVISLGTGGAGRSDAAGGTTSGSTTVTDAAAVAADAGKVITGPGIPPNTLIKSVTAGTGYVLSQAATATASPVTFVVGLVPVSAVVTHY
jgi:hypothetical protein